MRYTEILQIIGMIAPSLFTFFLASKKSNHDILKDNLNLLQQELEKLRSENDQLRTRVLELMSDNSKLQFKIDSLKKLRKRRK